MARTNPGTTIEHTAENIGAALGKVAAKFDAWSKQRSEIAKELHKVMGAAQAMLGELKVGDLRLPKVLGGKPRGRKPGFTLSPATRAKLKAAWARRKAAAGTSDAPKKSAAAGKAGAGNPKTAKPKREISAEGRARIAAAQRARWARQRRG